MSAFPASYEQSGVKHHTSDKKKKKSEPCHRLPLLRWNAVKEPALSMEL